MIACYTKQSNQSKTKSISKKTLMNWKYGLTNGVWSSMPRNVKLLESTDLQNHLKEQAGINTSG